MLVGAGAAAINLKRKKKRLQGTDLGLVELTFSSLMWVPDSHLNTELESPHY